MKKSFFWFRTFFPSLFTSSPKSSNIMDTKDYQFSSVVWKLNCWCGKSEIFSSFCTFYRTWASSSSGLVYRLNDFIVLFDTFYIYFVWTNFALSFSHYLLFHSLSLSLSLPLSSLSVANIRLRIIDLKAYFTFIVRLRFIVWSTIFLFSFSPDKLSNQHNISNVFEEKCEVNRRLGKMFSASY